MRFARWTMLTTAGLAGGLIAGLLVGMPLGRIVNAMIVTAAVTTLVGAILGTFQAIGLRQLLARSSWWILATTIGLGTGLAAGVVTVEQIGIAATGNRPHLVALTPSLRAASFIVLGLVAGVILGFAQWIVFRQQKARVRSWIPASGFALAVAFAGSSALIDLAGLRIATAVGVTTFVIASGMAFGALTSLPLRRAV